MDNWTRNRKWNTIRSIRNHLSELEELASQDLLDESELEGIVKTEIIILERPQIHSKPNSGACPRNSSQFRLVSNMVAKGIQITKRFVFHGHEFNVYTHAIFSLLKLLIPKQLQKIPQNKL